MARVSAPLWASRASLFVGLSAPPCGVGAAGLYFLGLAVAAGFLTTALRLAAALEAVALAEYFFLATTLAEE